MNYFIREPSFSISGRSNNTLRLIKIKKKLLGFKTYMIDKSWRGDLREEKNMQWKVTDCESDAKRRFTPMFCIQVFRAVADQVLIRLTDELKQQPTLCRLKSRD